MLIPKQVSLTLPFAATAIAKPFCRCLLGDACYPTPSDFSHLASQVSQPLLYPVPPESACYPVSNPSGNCTDVTVNTRVGRWRAEQSGAMQSPNFETYTFPNGTISACYLNVTLGVPCEQGSVSVLGVDARNVGDVQAAVKFAGKFRLRLAVKNTGHDYLGRSTARGSFMLWTHHMKNISYEEAFVPDGAPSGTTHKALTLGAGVQWYDAYDAAQANGRFILGGLSAGASVGAAGGWVLGGGHSALSARHGLGIDNVIQFTVITANGDILTVNSHKNTDLFWALRGGGGGTYGVVISATYLTHDPVPLSAVYFFANFATPEIAQTVVTEYIKIHPILADAGWGGYSFLSRTDIRFFYVAPNISAAETNATISPFFAAAGNATETQSYIVPFDSFYEWYQATFAGGEQVGTNVEMGSRLVPRDIVERNPAKVAQAMLAIEGGVSINFVAGGAVAKVDPDSTGLNPAWRKALAHVLFTEEWAEGQPASYIREVRKRLQGRLKILDRVTPESGAYFNEAFGYEKNPKKTFFGAHYPKLKAIKQKYDRAGLFVVADGVGSDDWDNSLNCRRR
ncbi:hypothetical protein Hypma_009405 [Hypsizygus marmoreus]|uniref:FAD-binding PCMH-type domain-containing protein n=1 Tax=Hypsizygus marmoreus TaxID=39966 RepID=A0A369JWI6_HYPMA|nr:hypothetical protein Hypma_009405 [Hypsizygus marmoreus]